MKTKNLVSILSLFFFAFLAIASSDNKDEGLFISDLSPADIYTTLENIGFKTDKIRNPEYGNTWTSLLNNYGGIDYRVDIYSTNVSNVISYRATASINQYYLNDKNISASQQFFILASSFPSLYDKSNSEEISLWIKNNFNSDKSTVTIGSAKFTMYAPSQYVRFLDVEKANDIQSVDVQ